MEQKPYHRQELTIYIASKFSSRDRLKIYKAAIENLGYRCLSHWMTDDPDMPVDPSSYADSLGNNFEDNHAMAIRDIEDVYHCDIFLICTEDESLTGGRDVELGQALMFNKQADEISGVPGSGKILMRVGPMRNVFHALVPHYSWQTAMHRLSEIISLHNEEEDYNERQWYRRYETDQS